MKSAFAPQQFIASRVANLQEYAPEPLEAVAERLGMPLEQLIKLDANENPYGPTPAALTALKAYDYYHQYPDAISRKLRAALADYVGVPMENILVGNGSDELIDMTVRLFRPGEDEHGIARLITCPPTFGMYDIYASANDLEIITIPRKTDFSLDLESVEALFEIDSTPAILFVASPNNPDGKLLPESDLGRLLSLPALVVVDEAYIEFAGTSYAPLVLEYENLIVLRTFSKWAGLAGLRVGYGVYPAELMPSLWRQKAPYNVNCAAQVAALATLEHVEEALERLDLIKAERDRLIAALNALDGIKVLPSDTNFVLVEPTKLSINEVRERMEARGIMIRYYGSPDLKDYVRVSVGTPEQNALLIAAFTA